MSGFPEVFRGLPSVYRDIVLHEILTKLGQIRAWFQSQSHLAFRGSSVLIAFEGDLSQLSRLLDDSIAAFNESGKSDRSPLVVKMIDFVYVRETSDPDNNYIEGITSLMEYFTNMQRIFSPSPS